MDEAMTSERSEISAENRKKEKQRTDDFCSNRKYYAERGNSDSPSHGRRRSPYRRSTRDSSDNDQREPGEYSQERKIYFTENRRISYASKDTSHEPQYSKSGDFYHSSSKNNRYDDRKSLDRHQRSSRERFEVNEKRVVYCKSDFTEINRHRVDEKESNERRNYKEELNDVQATEKYHDRSFDKPEGKSRRLFRKTYDHEDFKEDRVNIGYGENQTVDRENSYKNDHCNELDQNNYCHFNGDFNSLKPNNERNISYRVPSVSGNDEFVASLSKKIALLNSQVEHLSRENEKLNHLMKEDSTAEVSITFGNKKFEKKFSPILKEVATDLITGRCSVEALTSFLENANASQFQSESWNPEGELFSLDLSCEEPKESSSIPRYDTSFNEILSPDGAEKKAANKKQETQKKNLKSCFNCDGDHTLTKCPHPLNREKIAKSKKQLFSRSSFGQTMNKRYHVYGNQESEFKPGVISDELRKALDLKEYQIPQYIYRMRIIDYPPGWLAEAEVESSGIALYDSEGVAHAQESDKDVNEVKFDPAKLIDYPGFNSPLPPDFMDEAEILGLPPMQSYQSRDYIEQVIPKTDIAFCASRKRKLVLPEPKNSKTTRLDESMEVDDDLAPSVIEFNPPLPEGSPPPPPPDDPPDLPGESLKSSVPKTSPQLDSDSSSGVNTPNINPDPSEYTSIIEPFKLKGNLSPSSGADSPSLRELEEMKKRLVIELGIAAESSSPVVQDAETESPITLPSTPFSDFIGTVDSINELSNISDSSFSSKASGCADTSKILKRTDSVGSRLVTLGTPSISRHSSYSKLPDYENFSKDVTSHLNFENLPNSTGTYEKMKKIIKKVKQKINTIMQ